MLSRLATAALLLLPAAAAEAAPSWKSAPGGDKKADSGFSFDPGVEFAWDYYLEIGMRFLGDYWEWFGVLFIVLALYLFARGPKKEAAADDGEDVFFEDGEDAGYR